MEKFLFTDGTNGVREVQSQQELQNLILSVEHPDKIRIWLFNTNEWISYAAYCKLNPAPKKKTAAATSSSASHADVSATQLKPPSSAISRGLKKIVYLVSAAIAIFLVFNFTKIKWQTGDPLIMTAVTPANVPPMDIDSLIYEIELLRGQPIDRNTKNNLRLRNTWPDRIILQVAADRETSNAGSRFSNVDISIDNTTGLSIDNAVVKFIVWKNSKAAMIDTLRFTTIRFDKLLKRRLNDTYRGDSLSVSFESIKAKSFNFCYSAAIKNNSGNYNDRWFCRE